MLTSSLSGDARGLNSGPYGCRINAPPQGSGSWQSAKSRLTSLAERTVPHRVQGCLEAPSWYFSWLKHPLLHRHLELQTAALAASCPWKATSTCKSVRDWWYTSQVKKHSSLRGEARTLPPDSHLAGRVLERQIWPMHAALQSLLRRKPQNNVLVSCILDWIGAGGGGVASESHMNTCNPVFEDFRKSWTGRQPPLCI